MKLALDKLLEVWTEQEITATCYSTAIQFPAECTAEGSHFDIRVKTAMDGAGSVVFSIQDSDDDSTYVSRVSSASLAKANLPATTGGKPVLSLWIPSGLGKYVRLACTVTGTVSAGKVTANLVAED